MDTGVFIYLQFLRNVVLPLPGVTEKLCFGTPAFYVNKKIFVRIREDGETLVLHTKERDKCMAAKPKVYFITEHYYNYDYMLVNLPKADPEELKSLLIQAWKNRANKKTIVQWAIGQDLKI
ncbi:MmcQ/YjbR family DNA-binding protein [Mucilaginibacter psychrotolerans]|nr:MmcQ/YjbR family DNA-binding protein [Mucilaginibacter psychrotolerans]